MEKPISKLEETVNNTPPIGGSLSNLLNLIQDESIGTDDLTPHISDDPILAASILKLANSPFYGLPREISSVKEACVLVGISALKNIIYASTITSDISSARNIEVIDKIDLHTKHAAAWGFVLAKHCKEDQNLCYTATLLHELGKQIYAQSFPDQFNDWYKRTIAVAKPQGEIPAWGFTYSEYGVALGKQWNFPEVFMQCIAHHKVPEKASLDHKKIVYITHLADLLATASNQYSPGDRYIMQVDENVLDLMNLCDESLMALFSEINDYTPSKSI